MLLSVVAAAMLPEIHGVATAAARPADNPCVKWVAGGCHGGLPGGLGAFIPAILSAWEWHKDGNYSGSCSACSGSPNDMRCANIFPCFGVSEPDVPDVDTWGRECKGQDHTQSASV
eukprot:COSAG01_NODE_400_length_17542_cov_19.747005_14_plen_116_part_00